MPNTLGLPFHGAQIPSLIRELDPTCHMAWQKKTPENIALVLEGFSVSFAAEEEKETGIYYERKQARYNC